MLSQIEAEHHQALKKLRNEVELQIPLFLKMAIMELSLDDIEEEDKIDILRMLNGPKFENRQQFLMNIPEYLIKYLLKIRKISLANLPEINAQNPKNLSDFLYTSILPYEDFTLLKYNILQNIVKNVNQKIMDFLNKKEPIIKALKIKDIQIMHIRQEIHFKKQISKSQLQQNCQNCLCKIRKLEQSQTALIKCSQCKEFYHAACLNKNQDQKFIICPFCIMNNTNPLEKVVTKFLNPVLLDMSETNKEKSLNFECPQQQLNFQIQLRCLELGEVDQFKWPEAGEIFLNNQKIINIDKKNKQKQSYSITSSVKYGNFNRITILYQQSFLKQLQFLNVSNKNEVSKQQFLFGVFGVKIQTIKELILELYQKFENQISIEESQKKIMKYMRKMTLSQIKISFLDPKSSKIIKIPGRGNMCRHIQCFDIEVFLNNGQSSNQWDCPVCAQRCFSLQFDKYFEYLLDKFKGSNITEVELDAEAQLIGDYDQLSDDMQIEL